MKPYKIIEMKLIGNLGAYDYHNRIIYIDERLRAYPKLRQVVLNHELGHLKDRHMNDALIRDLRDYPLMATRDDYFEYIEKIKKQNPSLRLLLQQLYYSLMRIFFVVPISLLISAYKTIMKIKGGKNL